ncbi:MAG TPA: hypothetical protein VNU21_01055 [Usitatibacter sp.]|nr:hypothetical protein [Usitatibacter sp.]
MKERPILFSAPMVRAILEGRKTQTRRVVKRPRTVTANYVLRPELYDEPGFTWWNHPDGLRCGFSQACPYGKPGDRLWVRETWRPALEHLSECTGPTDIRYAATVSEAEWATMRWRPSIHMPRWASRINLEVTGVRVERLQDISEQDAADEGVGALVPPAREGNPDQYRKTFRELWETINGADSWAANPWVWVVEFKRAPQ